MTYLNQFHKEASERKVLKISPLLESPIKSEDAVKYVKRNLELVKQIEAISK